MKINEIGSIFLKFFDFDTPGNKKQQKWAKTAKIKNRKKSKILKFLGHLFGNSFNQQQLNKKKDFMKEKSKSSY